MPKPFDVTTATRAELEARCLDLDRENARLVEHIARAQGRVFVRMKQVATLLHRGSTA